MIVSETTFLKQHCDSYIGIFSPDTLPESHIHTGCLVCNLSNSNTLGSHFVSIIMQTDRVLYIDSFGVPCENEEIQSFLSAQTRPVFYNSTMIQDINSSFCGFFCILFCLYFDRKTPFRLLFYSKLIQNDLLCVQLINRLRNKEDWYLIFFPSFYWSHNNIWPRKIS